MTTQKASAPHAEAQLSDQAIVCPWCRFAHHPLPERASGRYACERCGGRFQLRRQQRPVYGTTPVAECAACGTETLLDDAGRLVYHGCPGPAEAAASLEL